MRKTYIKLIMVISLGGEVLNVALDFSFLFLFYNSFDITYVASNKEEIC